MSDAGNPREFTLAIACLSEQVSGLLAAAEVKQAENAALRKTMAGMVCGTCLGRRYGYTKKGEFDIGPCPVCQPKEGT